MIHIPALILIILSLILWWPTKVRDEEDALINIGNGVRGIMFVMLAGLYEWFISH